MYDNINVYIYIYIIFMYMYMSIYIVYIHIYIYIYIHIYIYIYLIHCIVYSTSISISKIISLPYFLLRLTKHKIHCERPTQNPCALV